MIASHERKVTWLASISHFFTHGYMTLLPAVLTMLAGIDNLGFFYVGVIANAGYFLFGLGSIPFGMLSDRIGAKRALTLCMLLMSLTSILVGLSGSTIGLAVSYAFLGLAASIYHPAGLSLIARHVEKKGKALGLHSVMGNLGLALAPLFAALMVMLFNTWRAVYISFGLLGLAFAGVLAASRVKGEDDLTVSEMISALRANVLRPILNLKGQLALRRNLPAQGEDAVPENKTVYIPLVLVLLYVECVLFGFIYRGSLTFFPALFQQEVGFISSRIPPWNTVSAGVLASSILLLGVIGAWISGYVIDRLKHIESAQFFIFAAVVPLLYLVGRGSNYSVILFSSVFSFIFFAWQPFQNALIAKYTSRRSHGVGYGVNFFLIMGVGSVATAVGGNLTADYGAYAVYSMLSKVSVAALIVALGVMKLKGYSFHVNYALRKDSSGPGG